MAIRLSKNFTLEELCDSATAKALGIRNVPGTQEIANLSALVNRVLQPLRDIYGGAVKIGSGFRCQALNKAVGGVSNSQHMKGEAADLCIDGDINKGKKWIEIIRTLGEFDQLIWEKNPKTGSYWVHVSYRSDGKNRKQYIPEILKK